MPHRLRVAMLAFAHNHHTTRWSQSLAQAGLNVQLVCERSAQPYRLQGVAVRDVEIPLRGVPLADAAGAWSRAIEACQPHVVYMQWLFARPAMMVALRDRWPLVVTVMGSDVRQDPASPETVLERVFRTGLLRSARIVTAAAQPLAATVLEYDESLLERLHIVPFGVDAELYRPSGRRRHRPDEPFVVGHFKGDDPLYGRLDLLTAVEPLIRSGLPLHLLFAGLVGQDPRIPLWLQAHPHVAQRVTQVGPQPVTEMPALYHRIDAYALPSQQESFGVAVGEALASGVPVVAYQVGGVRDLVRPGDTGLLVPHGDVQALGEGLQELLLLPDLAASCAERGRRRIVSRFPWSRSVDRMVQLLHAAAEGRKPARSRQVQTSA